MPLPTLLVPGSLAGPAGEAHPEAVPLEYLLGLLRAHLPGLSPPPRAASDRVWVVRSETGSGKSTALPAAVFRLLRGKAAAATPMAGPGVICTQPRVLTAVSLARDMAASPAYPDLEMGVTVGYATGQANEKPARGLVYATSGVLLAQLRREGDAAVMDRYRFVLVDEAHEASLDTALLLLALKGLLARNLGDPRLPFVLLTSATFDPAKYARYFGVGGANVVEVAGRAYPIETHWPPGGVADYPAAAARTAAEIHRAHPDDPPHQADILIFMPGLAEIDAVVRALAEANREHLAAGAAVRPFLTLALSRSEIENEGPDFRRLGVPLADATFLDDEGARRRPLRRIIVSTVVAETGLTLSALKYVIDCGWYRGAETYYPSGAAGLVTRPAPQSRIRQRKGRAGRLFPGEFYPLYTRETYEALDADQPPDLAVQGFGPLFLPLAAMTAAANGGVFRVGDIDLLDPPPVDALAGALAGALVGGYLEARPAAGGHALTPLGDLAAAAPALGPEGLQTILAAYLWGASAADAVFLASLYGGEASGGLPPFYLRPPPPGGKGPAPPAKRPPPGDGALLAGLPPFLREGSGSLPPGAEGARAARALLADDFLEALLAFEGFVRALRDRPGPSALADWCLENGLDYEKTVAATARRERFVAEALAAGLNPFWGHERRLAAAASAEDFRGAVRRLKRCLHAGLRSRLLTYDPAANEYRGRHGERVGVPPAYTDAALARPGGPRDKPRRLVTDRVAIRKAPGGEGAPPPLLYRLAPGLVSVIDGDAPDDAEAWEPRRGAAY